MGNVFAKRRGGGSCELERDIPTFSCLKGRRGPFHAEWLGNVKAKNTPFKLTLILFWPSWRSQVCVSFLPFYNYVLPGFAVLSGVIEISPSFFKVSAANSFHKVGKNIWWASPWGHHSKSPLAGDFKVRVLSTFSTQILYNPSGLPCI